MPDIFDQLETGTKPDIFDSVATEPRKDVFDSLGSAEIQQADEQQAMERHAGATATVGDLKNVLGSAMKLPAKAALIASGAGALQWPTDKQLETPLVSPEAMKTVMPYSYVADAAARAFPDNPVAQVAQGTTGALTDAASGFTSPENLAMLGAAPESTVGKRLVAGFFEGQGLLGLPDQWEALKNAKTLSEKTRIAGGMALGTGLPLAGFLPEAKGEVKPNEANISDEAGRNGSTTGTGEALGQDNGPSAPDAIPQDVARPVNPVSAQPEVPSLPVEQSTPEIQGQGSSGLKEADVNADNPTGQNTPEPVEHGEFQQEGYTATDSPRVTDPDPFVSRIANRFTEERAKQGEIGEVAPGEGYATSDLVQRGLKMSPEEVAQHVSDIMNDAGGDPVKQAAAIRAEEARLSDRSTELSRAAEANPRDLAARQAANAAFQDLTDFHNGPVAKLKTRFHATGMALQGEIPVDLSTFNGLREAWLKDTGKVPPESMEPTFRRTAENVRRTVAEEGATTNRLGQEIEKATRSRKLPSADEVINAMREEMGLGPCRI